MSLRASALLGRLVVVACASAACGSSSSAGVDQTSAGAGGTGAGGAGGGASGAGGEGGSAAGAAGVSGAAGSGLLHVPMATYPACDPVVNSCCKYLECYSPPNVGDACAPAPANGFGSLAMGTAPICAGVATAICSCGKVEGPFAGPYGVATAFTDPPNSANCTSGMVGTFASPYQDGACCYLVPLTSSCAVPGRPIAIAGAVRVAGLLRRVDWG